MLPSELPFRCLFLLPALAVSLSVASGQTWSAGLTTGLLPTNDLRSEGFGYTAATSRLLLGPTVRLRLPSGIGFEAGALRKGVDFKYSFGRLGIGLTEFRNQAAAWQFPFLFHYGRESGRLAPYLHTGFALRRITGTQQTGRSCTQLPTMVCTPIDRNEASELENPTTGGVVIGGGAEFGSGLLRLSPEVRYTRWLSRPFTTPLSSQNQLEVLVRIAVPFSRPAATRGL